MNQQERPHPREHHFYVAIAKFLFHHPEYGIVTVRDPIKLKDAEQYGLSPLILYGLTVAGLPIRWMTYSPADHPRPFRDILLEAWGNAVGLRGHPDILKVNRHIAQASQDLARNLAEIGVRVEVAHAKEKSLPASLRSAQDASRWLLGKLNRGDLSLAGSVQSLCQVSQYDHDWHVRCGPRGVNNREMEARVQQWLALPTQSPIPTQTGELDWEVGPWLSSWESSLPPNPPRYFNLDRFDDRTWLLTGEKTPEDIVEDDDFWADSFFDNAAKIAKNLVACWPNPPAEIAKVVGVTVRELQWFTSERAPLDRHKRYDLEALLGIEYDERMGGYVGVGPYVLIAYKPLAIQKAYEAISKGGDARPCEIIPRQGATDPSWRYVLINTYGEPPSIVMSPRGAKITERLPDLLMNYAGITQVSPDFYRDVVSTCARACLHPAANVHEMSVFGKIYKKHWIGCAWEPE